MTPPLLPLRIAATWAVLFNSLVDLGFDEATPSERDAYFSQDVLSLAQVALRDGAWMCPDDGYVIDVGWYDDVRPGRFRLRVLAGDWDHVIGEVATRERALIARVIEEVTQLLGHRGGDVEVRVFLASLDGGVDRP